jgi:hypothetical protein
MTNIESINKRISSLQAIYDIRDLKYKYWNACDSKSPAKILECFFSDEVHIDFEEFGIFSFARDMVDKYEYQSCHDHLIEQHAGKNPIINLLSEYEGQGLWSMFYTLIDINKNIQVNVSGIYEDLYMMNSSGKWLIKKTIFRKRSSILRFLSSGYCKNSRIGKTLYLKKTV